MMFNRINCNRKSQLSGILTEPLNPREGYPCESSYGETLEIMLLVPLNMGINNYREIFLIYTIEIQIRCL